MSTSLGFFLDNFLQGKPLFHLSTSMQSSSIYEILLNNILLITVEIFLEFLKSQTIFISLKFKNKKFENIKILLRET